MPAFGLKGWGVQAKDGKVSYTFTEEGFRAYLEFMHKLYEEKLLDQEIFSQSNEQKLAKGQQNRIGVFQEWFSYFVTGKSEEEAIEDPMFGPLTSDYQKTPVMPISSGIKRGSFVITKDNPSPEAALRWIDYFYSEEGFEYLHNGPEGYLWQWDDKKEHKQFTDKVAKMENPEDYRASITPAYGITVPALSVKLEDLSGESDHSYAEFIQKETQEKIVKYGEEIYPMTYLTPEEQKEVGAITVDLETYMMENEAQFIKGTKELNDETWKEYLDTMNDIGAKRLIEIHQTAYDRWGKIK